MKLARNGLIGEDELLGRIAYAIPLRNHPVLGEKTEVRERYLRILGHFMRHTLLKSGYSKAVWGMYKKVLSPGGEALPDLHGVADLKLYARLQSVMLFDLLAISGYDCGLVESRFLDRFQLNPELSVLMRGFFEGLSGGVQSWEPLLNEGKLSRHADWIGLVRGNFEFSRMRPFNILVTSTMSSGKSTFINAIAGKRVANTENLACTGRIHRIFGKPFEDGLVGRWNGGFLLDAKPELDSAIEKEDSPSFESVYFNGGLGGARCSIVDTPGVNSAMNSRHGELTRREIKGLKYDAVVFLLNYEHIGTDDEKAHLAFVRFCCQKKVPVIFVVNKVDSLKSGDLTLDEKMADISSYLGENGFGGSEVFMVSSRAAFLSRMRNSDGGSIDEDEEEELDDLTRKLRNRVDLAGLYEKNAPLYGDWLGKSAHDGFDYRCGIGYVEDCLAGMMRELKGRN